MAVVVPESLTLRGRRIVLTSPTPADDAAMRLILSHFDNVRRIPLLQRSPHWTIQEVVARRQSQMADQQQSKSLVLYIHIESPSECEDDLKGSLKGMVVAGTTGFRILDLQGRSAELGVIVHHPFCGTGLATEAMHLCLSYGFQSLGLKRVDWLTAKDNIEMRGWLEGFLGLQPKPVQALEDGDENLIGYSLSYEGWCDHVRRALESKTGIQEERHEITLPSV